MLDLGLTNTGILLSSSSSPSFSNIISNNSSVAHITNHLCFSPYKEHEINLAITNDIITNLKSKFNQYLEEGTINLLKIFLELTAYIPGSLVSSDITIIEFCIIKTFLFTNV